MNLRDDYAVETLLQNDWGFGIIFIISSTKNGFFFFTWKRATSVWHYVYKNIAIHEVI